MHLKAASRFAAMLGITLLYLIGVNLQGAHAADTPAGIRLIWKSPFPDQSGAVPAERRTMLKWSASPAEIESALSAQPGSSFNLECYSTGHDKYCPLPIKHELEGWFADFGEGIGPYGFKVTIRLFQDKFYAYSVLFPHFQFLPVANVLEKALGKATKQATSSLQNKFGAKFDQIEKRWSTKEVEVTLTKRTTDDLETGSFSLSFKPIAKTIPPSEAKGSAPF